MMCATLFSFQTYDKKCYARQGIQWERLRLLSAQHVRIRNAAMFLSKIKSLIPSLKESRVWNECSQEAHLLVDGVLKIKMVEDFPNECHLSEEDLLYDLKTTHFSKILINILSLLCCVYAANRCQDFDWLFDRQRIFFILAVFVNISQMQHMYNVDQ